MSQFSRHHHEHLHQWTAIKWHQFVFSNLLCPAKTIRRQARLKWTKEVAGTVKWSSWYLKTIIVLTHIRHHQLRDSHSGVNRSNSSQSQRTQLAMHNNYLSPEWEATNSTRNEVIWPCSLIHLFGYEHVPAIRSARVWPTNLCTFNRFTYTPHWSVDEIRNWNTFLSFFAFLKDAFAIWILGDCHPAAEHTRMDKLWWRIRKGQSVRGHLIWAAFNCLARKRINIPRGGPFFSISLSHSIQCSAYFPISAEFRQGKS